MRDGPFQIRNFVGASSRERTGCALRISAFLKRPTRPLIGRPLSFLPVDESSVSASVFRDVTYGGLLISKW
jgi:hypothetical protein